jgi:hypothetical protein
MATSLGMAVLSLLEARRTWRIIVLSLVLGQLLLAPPAMVAASLRLTYWRGLLASQPAARPNRLESLDPSPVMWAVPQPVAAKAMTAMCCSG